MKPSEMTRTFLKAIIIIALGIVLLPDLAIATNHPTAPREVNCRAITSTRVECFWFPSRDNEGVTYRIYRGRVTAWNGQSYLAAWDSQTLIGTSPNDGMGRVGFIDTGLTPATDYIYWVSAVDPQGNESARITTAHSAPTTLFPGALLALLLRHRPR